MRKAVQGVALEHYANGTPPHSCTVGGVLSTHGEQIGQGSTALRWKTPGRKAPLGGCRQLSTRQAALKTPSGAETHQKPNCTNQTFASNDMHNLQPVNASPDHKVQPTASNPYWLLSSYWALVAASGGRCLTRTDKQAKDSGCQHMYKTTAGMIMQLRANAANQTIPVPHSAHCTMQGHSNCWLQLLFPHHPSHKQVTNVGACPCHESADEAVGLVTPWSMHPPDSLHLAHAKCQ